jgi:hypothetical protein
MCALDGNMCALDAIKTFSETLFKGGEITFSRANRGTAIR